MNAIELIEKYRSEVLAKKPYRMNLIELLHANENAHTRILVELLRYNHGDSNFEFTKSFLHRFVRGAGDMGVPEINEQLEYIDAIIGEKGKYAVVVENKINWAQDQDGQVERYLKSAKDLFSVGYEKLYFIYLTDNGAKQVSDQSLTSKARKLLGMCDNQNGRFIELNYRDHILPWIKDVILPSCRYKEVQTISALEQYVDYLEGRLVDDVRSDSNEELFVEEICPHKLSDGERYGLFADFRKLLDADLPQGTGVDIEFARDELYALIERKMETLHDAEYSLDASYAVSKMVSRIRDWGYDIDYYGPHVYQRTDVIVSEVRLKNGSRMKLDINVNTDRRLDVQFFDNDRVSSLEKTYPRLVRMFQELFGPYEGDEYWIRSFSDEIKNASMLDGFLRTKATPFMLQFKKDVLE